MIKLWDLRIYYGTENWGWNMYGFGFGMRWFFGLSIVARKDNA